MEWMAARASEATLWSNPIWGGHLRLDMELIVVMSLHDEVHSGVAVVRSALILSPHRFFVGGTLCRGLQL